jgi:hypothetical protein
MAFENTTAGSCKCPACGHDVIAKVNKKGHLYVYCSQPADGGCGGGYVSRSHKADGIIAAKVTKWRDPKAREHFHQWVDGAAADEGELEEETETTENPSPTVEPSSTQPAPKRAPVTSKTSSATPRAPVAKKPTSWWDKDLV